MKKMVCEICDSMKIKKIGDAFVCQDCGTEYDLASARNLLKEVDSSEVVPAKELTEVVVETKNKTTDVLKNDEDKYVLLKELKTWYELINGFSDVYFWIHFERNSIEYHNLTVGFDGFKDSIVNATKLNIPLIEKDWFIRCLNFKTTDADMEKKVLINSLYSNRKDPVSLFYNDTYIKIWNDHFFRASMDKVYYNGQGPFYRHFFGQPGNLKIGYMWGAMHNNYGSWFEFAETSETYCSYVSSVSKGLIFDKVTHNNNENTIKAAEFKKRVSDLYKQISERHKDIVTFYNANFDNMKQYYIELCDKVYEMEKVFNLPMKYRNSNYIAMLITYIKDGRVDSWKEAINLLEQEIYQNNVIKSLSNIANVLIDIDNNIKEGFEKTNSQLMNISIDISQISSNIFKCTENLRKIQKDTRFNLIWNL